MTNGRRKGASAEREVAALVQTWWQGLPIELQETPDNEPSEFVRTPQSGGWSTKRVRGAFRVAGDLSSTSNSWPFTVEVKRREKWTLTTFIKAGKVGSPVWDWWEQTVTSAQEEGGVPMLWMRRSRTPWMVLVPAELGRSVIGTVRADIFWATPNMIAHHNRTDIHPIGFLAEKVLESDPKLWLEKAVRSSLVQVASG